MVCFQHTIDYGPPRQGLTVSVFQNKPRNISAFRNDVVHAKPMRIRCPFRLWHSNHVLLSYGRVRDRNTIYRSSFLHTNINIYIYTHMWQGGKHRTGTCTPRASKSWTHGRVSVRFSDLSAKSRTRTRYACKSGPWSSWSSSSVSVSVSVTAL